MWGHGDEDVVGEQGDDGVEVGRLVRGHESRQEGALGSRARSRWGLAVPHGQAPSVEAGASALQGAGDGLDGRVQHLGRLLRGEAQDVTQHEHGDLPVREHL
jgi:hypothetical protein